MTEPTPTHDQECTKCAKRPPWTFRYLDRQYLFDVDRALVLVADGRAPVELDPDDVRYCVETNKIVESHIPHVDHSIPGIMSHVYYPKDDGGFFHGHVLIDGNHRAARCLQLGVPYFVYLLTEEESRAILLRSPETAPCP